MISVNIRKPELLSMITETRLSRYYYINLTFAAEIRHSSLWQQSTTFLGHREAIRIKRPPQFVMANDHNT